MEEIFLSMSTPSWVVTGVVTMLEKKLLMPGYLTEK
jgi:hypothetical protein